MTDSTTDKNPADGAFDTGTSVDELFGEFEIGDESGDERRTAADGEDTGGEEPDGIEDTTAADVFDQLRADAADDGGADAVLADESPEDIIASADEPEPEPDRPVDDDLLADEDELEDLLLTGRTKDQEFLWVETEESDGTDETEDSDGLTDGTDETEAGEASDGEASTAEKDTETDTSVDDASQNADTDDTVQTSTDDAAASDTDADRGTASIAVSTDGRTASSAGSGSDDAPKSTASHTEDRSDTEDGDENTDVPATRDDKSSGLFAWLRSILGGLF